MILVDTDILIWVLRGDEGYTKSFKQAIEKSGGLVYITPIQIAEIIAGARAKERKAIDKFLDSLTTLPIDGEIGIIAGEFINRYGKSHNVTLADALIGATAKANEFKLWTLNKKHYPMLTNEDFAA